MAQPVRPLITFVLRLWREPGAQEGDAGWRGLIRSLDAAEAGEHEVTFHGLGNLTAVLHRLLREKETSSTTSDAPP